MMRRRMAQMNARMGAGMSATGGGPSHGKDTGGGGGAAPPYVSGPGPTGNQGSIPGNAGKPGLNAQPNQAVMDAVKKVLLIINKLHALNDVILSFARFRRRQRCSLILPVFQIQDLA